jgi:hypothetical protein
MPIHFAGPTLEGLHQEAVRRFCRLLSIETDQMERKFLTSQLLLMSNIAEHYLGIIPSSDWLQLINIATEKGNYISKIIESDSRPRGWKKACEAYNRFVEAVISHAAPLSMAA